VLTLDVANRKRALIGPQTVRKSILVP
jgi:hypothetical protein